MRDVYNPNAQQVSYTTSEAAWTYNTNITDHNIDLMVRLYTALTCLSKQADRQTDRHLNTD